jgi:hypothetical protein
VIYLNTADAKNYNDLFVLVIMLKHHLVGEEVGQVAHLVDVVFGHTTLLLI